MEKEITKITNELQKKSTWIRKGMKDFLKKWAEISECGEEIDIEVANNCEGGYNFGETLYLVTGKNELQVYCGTFEEPSERIYSWDALSIEDIRFFAKQLPENLKKIMEKMEHKNKLSDEARKFFKNF